MPLYFAYGSNLDWKQMRRRCPSAQFVCVAKLKGHRFDITRCSAKRGCGVADVVADNSCDVWGVVYEIDEGDWERLDRCEGCHPQLPQDKSAYVRRECHVLIGGDERQPLLTQTYFANRECNPPPPSKSYMDQIIEGAKHWRLPQDYIRMLKQIEVKQ